MSISTTDLLLPDTELAQLTEALSNVGQDNPLGTCISEAEALVDDYCAQFTVATARKTPWIRAVAIWKAYRLVGVIPDAHQKAYDAAMRELEAVRDGKFGYPVSSSPPTAAAGGEWGSDDTIFE